MRILHEARHFGIMATAALLVVTSAYGDQSGKAEPGAAPNKDNPIFNPVKDDPALPRVLLIGDSISMGYTLAVRKLLNGVANVHRIPENGGPTINGVRKIEEWLGDGKWDVIHFNWGLHDLKYIKDKHQVSIQDYEKNLELLVKRMKATGAKLVWCSTTPVPEGKLNPPRKPEDCVAYNAAAKKVMEKNGVPINDLYAYCLPKLAEIQIRENVHFTPKGSEALAKEVTRVIKDSLPAGQK